MPLKLKINKYMVGLFFLFLYCAHPIIWCDCFKTFCCHSDKHYFRKEAPGAYSSAIWRPPLLHLLERPLLIFSTSGLKCYRWAGPHPIFRTDSKQTLEWRVHTQFCLKLQLLSLLVANAHPKRINVIKLEHSILYNSCAPIGCLNITSLLLSIYH